MEKSAGKFLPITHQRTRNFLLFAILIQFLMAMLLALSAANYNIPVLLPVVGLVYLGLLPGLMILRAAGIRNLDAASTLVYSVGLSLIFSMIMGLGIDIISPFLGLHKPISLLPLLITETLALFLIGGIIYYRESRDSRLSETTPAIKIHMDWLTSPILLLLILLPVLAILGAVLVRLHSNNLILLIMMGLICVVAILAVFPRIMSKDLFPAALFCISLALLYRYTFISPYLTGWDAPLESYYTHMIIANSYWDYSFQGGYNGMLSITMLPAVFTHFLNIDYTGIFKYIYPLFFSLVPVTLYLAYKQFTTERKAFFAVFFFLSLQVFSDTMTSIMRQQIAELFFALLILLMATWENNRTWMKLLLSLFTIGVLVSHYSTSYIYIFAILVSWIGIKVFRRLFRPEPNNMLTWRYICLCLSIAASW
jgi:uncharacterized membrane protein